LQAENRLKANNIDTDTTSRIGKSPEPYLHAALVNSVDRKLITPQHKNPNTSQYPPLQSPYTRVYGKMKIFDTSPNISKLKLTNIHTTFFWSKISGQGGNRGAAKALTTDPNFEMRDVISPPQGTKRSGANKSTSAEKKNKSAPKETPTPPKHYWLGFEMMEKLTIEEGATPISTLTPIQSLIKSGFSEKEAKKFQKAIISYPHVEQTCFPLHRPDGIAGQHFNITQLPFEIETDPDTGLSQDYHVTIYFQNPSRQYTHEEVLALAQARLKEMRIALGNKIAEPIAILCRNGSSRHWAGTIKLHLKYPGVDGINLLNDIRPFILTLDEVMTVGKICKSFNTIANNNLLSVKISSPSLANVT
jgi:hypothetical protein